MATTKNIQTNSTDGMVLLLSTPNDYVKVQIGNGGEVSEASLLEAVLEYASERGLRHYSRKTKPKAERKPRARKEQATTSLPIDINANHA